MHDCSYYECDAFAQDNSRGDAEEPHVAKQHFMQEKNYCVSVSL